jgi:Fic family protein
MKVKTQLDEINELQTRIQSVGDWSEDLKNKINYQFRLAWNFHSNNMEGNTLTEQETRSVMVGNITIHGKPLKDVIEMNGHDEVISKILKMGKGELTISERRIKEIHATILFEGEESKRIAIGQWKTEDNYIYNYRGERFNFTTHREVPVQMHQLNRLAKY